MDKDGCGFDRYEIVSIFPLPDQMGKGFGKALLKVCVDEQNKKTD